MSILALMRRASVLILVTSFRISETITWIVVAATEACTEIAPATFLILPSRADAAAWAAKEAASFFKALIIAETDAKDAIWAANLFSVFAAAEIADDAANEAASLLVVLAVAEKIADAATTPARAISAPTLRRPDTAEDDERLPAIRLPILVAPARIAWAVDEPPNFLSRFIAAEAADDAANEPARRTLPTILRMPETADDAENAPANARRNFTMPAIEASELRPPANFLIRLIMLLMEAWAVMLEAIDLKAFIMPAKTDTAEKEPPSFRRALAGADNEDEAETDEANLYSLRINPIIAVWADIEPINFLPIFEAPAIVKIPPREPTIRPTLFAIPERAKLAERLPKSVLILFMVPAIKTAAARAPAILRIRRNDEVIPANPEMLVAILRNILCAAVSEASPARLPVNFLPIFAVAVITEAAAKAPANTTFPAVTKMPAKEADAVSPAAIRLALFVMPDIVELEERILAIFLVRLEMAEKAALAATVPTNFRPIFARPESEAWLDIEPITRLAILAMPLRPATPERPDAILLCRFPIARIDTSAEIAPASSRICSWMAPTMDDAAISPARDFIFLMAANKSDNPVISPVTDRILLTAADTIEETASDKPVSLRVTSDIPVTEKTASIAPASERISPVG